MSSDEYDVQTLTSRIQTLIGSFVNGIKVSCFLYLCKSSRVRQVPAACDLDLHTLGSTDACSKMSLDHDCTDRLFDAKALVEDW